MKTTVSPGIVSGIVLSAWLVLPCGAATDAGLAVIPEPQQVTRLDGEWTPTDKTVIVLGEAATDDERFAAAQLAEELRRAGGPQLSVVQGKPPAGAPPVWLGLPSRDKALAEVLAAKPLALPANLGDEGYLIQALPGELILAANTPTGAFYAVQTACQLLRKRDQTFGMSAIRIEDWPVLKHRMIMYDFARGQQANVAFVKRMIEQLSRYKLNELMFYLEDDYKFAKYPFLGRPGTWTRPMIEELVAYARPRHVQLVPQVESMGHATAFLRHDELAHLRENVAEYTGPKPYTSYCSDFCATAPGLEEFWDGIYGELAEVFSNSEFIHTGLDEAHGFGFCNRCQAYQKEHGNAGLLAQYLDLLNRVCRKHGKTMMYWDPWCGLGVKMDDWLKRQPKCDSLDQAYCFDYEYGNWSKWRIGLLQKAGVKKLFVSPGVIGWGCIYPDYYMATRNIHEFIRAGVEAGAEGVCTTTWEMAPGNFFEQTWYGHVYTAECAWSAKETDLKTFDRKFASSWFGWPMDEGPSVTQLVRSYTLRPFNECFWGTAGENGQTYTFCTTLFRRSLEELTEPYQPTYFHGTMRPFPEAKEAEDLAQLTDGILKTADRLRPQVQRNQMTFDFMELAARSYRHVARKVIVREHCARLYREARGLAATDPGATKERLNRIAAEFATLAEDFPYFTQLYTRAMNECGAPASSGGAFRSLQQRLERQTASVHNLVKALDADPKTRLPAAAVLGLGAGGTYASVGQWTPPTTPKGQGELTFDVSTAVTQPGAYTVRLMYRSGAHGVVTCGVVLLGDGKEISRDVHRGWSGASQSDHIYTVEIPAGVEAKKWTLAVTLDGSGGTDSTGDVEIRREKE